MGSPQLVAVAVLFILPGYFLVAFATELLTSPSMGAMFALIAVPVPLALFSAIWTYRFLSGASRKSQTLVPATIVAYTALGVCAALGRFLRCW